MTTPTKPLLCACAAFVSLFAMQQANASSITGIAPEPGIYSIAGQSVATPNPNNGEFVGVGNLNELSILQKHYFAALPGPSVAPVDIVLTVTDTGVGTTEYVVIENVQNSTGVDWIGYRVVLGFGVGGSFVQSTPGDGLDFDDEDNSPINFAPLPADFTVITRPSEDEIVATGGTLLDGQFGGTDFVFHLDVPDGISEFTLRQQPILIPEPSSAAAMLLLNAALIRRRRA
ncbi:MAG: choice-of-anchor F family protein [Planctomycetota bacterium]